MCWNSPEAPRQILPREKLIYGELVQKVIGTLQEEAC